LSTISAFPWSELARFDPEAARALARASVAVAPDRLDAAVRAAAALLGAEVHAHAGRAELVEAAAAARAVSPLAPTLTLDVGAAPGAPRVVIDLDPRLAACVIDRALGGEGGTAVPPPTAPLGALARGVLAYVAARVTASAEAERALRLRDVRVGADALSVLVDPEPAAPELARAEVAGAVVASTPVAAGAAAGPPSTQAEVATGAPGVPPTEPGTPAGAAAHGAAPAMVCWPFEVTVGPDAGTARAWMRRDALVGLAAGTTVTAALARAALAGSTGAASAVSAAAVCLTIDAGAARLTRAELGSLRAGDVVLLDACTVSPDADGRVEGWAYLRSASASGGVGDGPGARGPARPSLRWTVRLGPSGALHVESAETVEEELMIPARVIPPGPQAASPAADAEPPAVDVSSLPVDLVLELGRVTVPVAELAGLAPGAVLQTGLPLGAQVTLRVGDRAVASGELVQVDGEVGVRVLRVGP
jgi:type III secretion system YscQ/HrcQ family protein